MAALSDRAARNIEPGATLKEGTVTGLTLIGGSRKGEGKWNLRFQLNGRRRDMGLGNFPAVGVAAARLAGMSARAEIAQGIDPIDARDARRKTGRPVQTFGEIAKGVIAEAQARTANEKVAYQIARHLGPVYSGSLLDRPVNEITTTDVAAVLRPVWRTKPEVARKLYPAIRRVFEAARIMLKAEHGIVMDNPARWDDLKALGFEAPKALTRGSHPSLPYPRMPDFVAALRGRDATAARLLEFLILTNVRTGTALAAEWREIDLDAAVWIVPVDKLKDAKHRKEPFRIPLSPRAVAILREMEAGKTSRYVFPGATGKPLSNMAMLILLKRMNSGETKWLDPVQEKPIVPHGFRSSFRTWAEETAHFPHHAVETAMGHVVGTAVERIYNRTDALEQRRRLMDSWAAHCEPKSGENVVAFKRSGVPA
jgi:integrase